MKVNRRVKGLGFSVQRSSLKFMLLLMVVFTGFVAYADVPPPTKTDTVLKEAGFNGSNGIMVKPVEMATGMRSSGKIYVVVAVLSMVLIGLIIYLFTLDRKISKLEKENK